MAQKKGAKGGTQKQTSTKGGKGASSSQGRFLRWGLVLLAAAVAAGAIFAAVATGRPSGQSAGQTTGQSTQSTGQSAGQSGSSGSVGGNTKEKPDDWTVQVGGSAETVAAVAKSAGIDMSLRETELPGAEVEPRVLSQSPRIYLFENLLSAAECEFLKGLVDGRLKPAGVVTQIEDKHTVQTQSRNNEQIWLTPQEESTIPVLKHIVKRMHRVARIPDTDAEALQIGRYAPGQKYESHIDSDPAHDVERPATLLTYLSDVESGGDTLFPLKRRTDCASHWHQESDGNQTFGCARCCDSDLLPGTIRVKPKRGSAVLFFNHGLDGKIDRLSEHAACPVREGTKWIAQRWFRLQPYQNIKYAPDPRFDGLPTQPSREPWNGRVRELSSKAPRVYLLESFLSDGECAHLVDLAGKLQDSESAGGIERWRVSEEAELDDPVLAGIAKRLHRAARVPEANGERLELVRYARDSPMPFHRDSDAEGQRVATILIYLSNVEGGDTVFPRGHCLNMEDCCVSDGALRIHPRRGNAILFFSRNTGGKAHDKTAVHGACPVLGGTKWVAQRFFRVSRNLSIAHAADPEHDLPALSQVITR